MTLYSGNSSGSSSENAKKSSGKGELVRGRLEFGAKDSHKKKSLSMQFNPQNISISNSIGSKDTVFETPEGKKVTVAGRTVSSSLALELFFDAENAVSAVTAVTDYKEPEKSGQRRSPSGGTKEEEISAEFPDQGKNLSDILNFLDDILYSEEYHLVTFAWGKFLFSGNINSIAISIVLFDRYGLPKRAKVSMTVEREMETQRSGAGPQRDIPPVAEETKRGTRVSELI